ncbi:hypothetical protein GCM10011400_05420 [Paraburkholderia caffeinilytica]|uniref:Uncharacterized protein n=1 Tax=Paraburkholderia caffeinilytica TaxID=1761016 RepID=A0ABQ1LD18_9BURK|nr:hypothetical protein GCM10011400_05420 [Paraburkholderia caffeinilytica]
MQAAVHREVSKAAGITALKAGLNRVAAADLRAEEGTAEAEATGPRISAADRVDASGDEGQAPRLV